MCAAPVTRDGKRRYKDFKTAAQANAMVGGDNASRSIPIGIVLGAWKGMQGVSSTAVRIACGGELVCLP